MRVLVTGAAGFIGSAVSTKLLKRGDQVIGVDSLDPYYDVDLKEARLVNLRELEGFTDVRADIVDPGAFMELYKQARPDRVVHLAAQAGVRHSLKDPFRYVDVNVTGFLSVLEACRHEGTEHLVYASTSSVYGANTHMPFSTSHNVDHPVSIYAATKKANELMAHTYSHLFSVPTTGLRFFTVYGPWGRPDMALFTFTRKILAGEPIDVFNHGKHQRDFTYVDDITESLVRVLDKPAESDPAWDSDNPEPSTSAAPYRLFNIGSNNPIDLMRYIEALENALGREATKNFLPLQPGDVPATFADVLPLAEFTGFKPSTPVEVGIANFVDWYRRFYNQ